MQQTPILNLSVKLTATVEENRFVGFGGAYAAVGKAALGVSDYRGDAGKQISIGVLGTKKVQVTAAVVAGGLIEVGANGKGAPLDAGAAVARVISGTTAADGIAEVLLTPSIAAIA